MDLKITLKLFPTGCRTQDEEGVKRTGDKSDENENVRVVGATRGRRMSRI